MDFLISTAYAGAGTAAPTGSGEAVIMNIAMILILAILFYMLLIRPQKKRFEKHREMIDQIKKGDRVLTAGGLIGKVHQVNKDKDEVVIDLGKDIRVTALRSTIQNLVNDNDKAA